jgi:hypothetical protein
MITKTIGTETDSFRSWLRGEMAKFHPRDAKWLEQIVADGCLPESEDLEENLEFFTWEDPEKFDAFNKAWNLYQISQLSELEDPRYGVQVQRDPESSRHDSILAANGIKFPQFADTPSLKSWEGYAVQTKERSSAGPLIDDWKFVTSLPLAAVMSLVLSQELSNPKVTVFEGVEVSMYIDGVSRNILIVGNESSMNIYDDPQQVLNDFAKSIAHS